MWPGSEGCSLADELGQQSLRWLMGAGGAGGAGGVCSWRGCTAEVLVRERETCLRGAWSSGQAQDSWSSEWQAFPSLSEKQWNPHREFEGE